MMAMASRPVCMNRERAAWGGGVETTVVSVAARSAAPRRAGETMQAFGAAQAQR